MGSISPISGGSQPYYAPSTNPQEQEIKNAIDAFSKAAKESSSGGTISSELFHQCQDALNTIANDPKMPQNYRDAARAALQEFEGSVGQPNADQTLNSIVQTLKNMTH
jgi:uncharacterized protein (UPF0147 family)